MATSNDPAILTGHDDVVKGRMTDHFFIVGSGRCGTKMLRRMLIGHPDVEVCAETHFIPTLHDLFGLEPITFDEYLEVITDHYDSKGDSWVRNLHEVEGIEYANFEREFRAVCGEVERATAAEFTERFHRYLFGRDAPFVGDKTPHYGAAMDTITEFWPDAKFIHLIRDGVYAAESMTRHSGFRKTIGSGIEPREIDRQAHKGRVIDLPEKSITLEGAARFWEQAVTITSEQGAALAGDQYLELRYEDILADPDSALRRISQFLELPDAPTWHRDAVIVPYPFFLYRIDTRVDEVEYWRVFEKIADTMRQFEYPITDLSYDCKKELKRSLRYYRNNLTEPDYLKRFLYRKLY